MTRAPARSPRPAPRPGPWLPGCVLVALVVLGIALRQHWATVPNTTPDEFFYAQYGQYLVEHGLARTDSLVKLYVASPGVTILPSPTRVGHLWPLALLMRASGDHTFEAAEALSRLASVIALALAALFAWRTLGPWGACVAVLFLAGSPLDLAIARRGWQDAFVALLSLAMVLAFTVAAEHPRDLRRAIPFFLLGGYAVLVKETSLLLLGLGTLGLAIAAWRASGSPARALRVVAAGALALGIAGLVLSAVSGGFEPVRATFLRAAVASKSDPYMHAYQSGGPEYYVVGFGLLHAVPFALGFVTAVLIAARAPFALPPADRPRARIAVTACAWLVLAFAAVALIYPQKNMRFLSPIFVPVYLLAGWAVVHGLEWLRPRLPARTFSGATLAVAALLLVSALLDVRRFEHWFIARGVPDLATPWLTAPEK